MTSDARLILCGEAAGDRPPGTKDVLRLRNTGSHRNVHLQIDDISRTLATDVPPQLIDLVEIATFVYVADQNFTRGGGDVDDMGENWRRRFHFELPVRCLDLWRREDVSTALRDVLSFLSEDEYILVFREYKKPPAFNGYLNFAQFDYAFNPQRVILFSGGLDSLGGAVEETAINGRPVVLVTHQATTKLLNRHRTLRQLLDNRAKGPKPLHVTIRINKDQNLNREYTQRSRSFLYASLAAAIARMCGLAEIAFYENGTVSLNLPISRQVVGSRATRTTHPKVLAGFKHLFSLVTGQSFEVTNGFLWKTKSEIVKSITDAGCGGMIEWSTSCTHTWEISNAKPHCGTCSQCIDRRFAVLAAGATSYERADTYRVDLLKDPRDAGEPRTMLASYVETAQQVAAMSETDFFMRFGEVARIVRHLGGSPDENARSVFDLYRRHAKQILSVVTAGLSQHASEILARSLPESCLLRLVHDPSVPSEQRESGSPAKEAAVPSDDHLYYLRQRGEGWQIRFDGHEALWLKPAIGYAYLRELLRFPNKRFTVSELLVAVHGEKAAIPLGDGGELADAEARRAYGQRLVELDDELQEARDDNDIGRQTLLQSDREKLVAQIKAAGFKTAAKRNNSDLNNIRNSVGNAIRRALRAIEKYEPSAFSHLKPSISLGFSVTYHPSNELPWSF